MEKILVTGGAGYIGSHATAELLDDGYEVVVVDSLENGYIDLVDKRAKFYIGNVQDDQIMEKIFNENVIFAVMHFAGYIKVSESVICPDKYYNNNTYTTIKLLDTMKKANVKNIIFSSTAAVYGNVDENVEVTEDFPTNPINPYGMSKLMSEEIIRDYSKAFGFNYSIFRYFNVAGAHEKHKLGQMSDDLTALIPLVIKSVLDNESKLLVYGDDYDTKDGTGVRDYIHVTDLVRAHILAINKLKLGKNGIYNLGNGKGFSVLDIINAVEKLTKKNVKFEFSKRRAGDPACVIASSSNAINELEWNREYVNIEKILETTLKWNLLKEEEKRDRK